MEKYLYNSFTSFFNARKKLGYISDNKVQSLIIMNFIYRLVFYDYRGIIEKDDYQYIEKAISCLYGKNCLLPYRDYLKMGRLKIGEYTELSHRIDELLCAENLGDGVVSLEITKLKNKVSQNTSRVAWLESKKVIKPRKEVGDISDIDLKGVYIEDIPKPADIVSDETNDDTTKETLEEDIKDTPVDNPVDTPTEESTGES